MITPSKQSSFLINQKGHTMNEKHISTHAVNFGGTIELWAIEGYYFVKSVVSGSTKYSESVTKVNADYFIFDAVHYGCLDF